MIIKKGTKIRLNYVEAEDEWYGLSEGDMGIVVDSSHEEDDLVQVKFDKVRETYFVYVGQIDIIRD